VQAAVAQPHAGDDDGHDDQRQATGENTDIDGVVGPVAAGRGVIDRAQEAQSVGKRAGRKRTRGDAEYQLLQWLDENLDGEIVAVDLAIDAPFRVNDGRLDDMLEIRSWRRPSGRSRSGWRKGGRRSSPS
jgi:hypothetical protein